MSKQIAVRLPDDMVDTIDQLITRGDAVSRAELVTRAVKRELLLRAADQDARILARQQAGGFGDDMEELAHWVSQHPVDVDAD